MQHLDHGALTAVDYGWSQHFDDAKALADASNPLLLKDTVAARVTAVHRDAQIQCRCNCPPSNFTRSPVRRSSMRWKSKSRTLPLSKRTLTR